MSFSIGFLRLLVIGGDNDFVRFLSLAMFWLGVAGLCASLLLRFHRSADPREAMPSGRTALIALGTFALLTAHRPIFGVLLGALSLAIANRGSRTWQAQAAASLGIAAAVIGLTSFSLGLAWGTG